MPKPNKNPERVSIHTLKGVLEFTDHSNQTTIFTGWKKFLLEKFPEDISLVDTLAILDSLSYEVALRTLGTGEWRAEIALKSSSL